MGVGGDAISRRDVARWALLGGGSLSMASLVAACSDGADRSAGSAPSTTARSTTSPPPTSSPPPSTSTVPTTVAVDPTRPWWLQGNFAPVTDEIDAFDLDVTGSIPPALTGQYVRNGSNPAGGESPHWFFGDGMVHGVRLERGRATVYRNRYVRTTMYAAGAGFGEGAPGGASNQSNISCVWHGGRLLTTGEVGFPYELAPDDLSTRGVHDFAGALTTAYTAHPKVDPATGRLHSFGYGFTPPYLTYHVTEADGTLVHAEAVDVPRSTMMHDFAITDRDAVFWDLPVVFDLDAAIRYLEDPEAGFPYRWTPEAGSRVGVLPLAGGADRIQWFELDPCYVFHGVNAHRDGDRVVVDVCRLSSMFEDGQVLGGDGSLRRWTLDTVTGGVVDDVLEEDDPGDLPSRDPRRVGRPYRYGYLVGDRPHPDTLDLGGLIKHDYVSGSRERWDPGPGRHSGEWLFVPDETDPTEDAGYLLGFVHDDATAATELAIIDATAVRAGPVARIALPQRVPFGFHGAWIPG